MSMSKSNLTVKVYFDVPPRCREIMSKKGINLSSDIFVPLRLNESWAF